MRNFRQIQSLRRCSRAFSVIELMLAIALMGVIVYALYSVFNQTQRALRATETSSDVAEKARAIVEMMTREIQQAQPTFSFTRAGTNRLLEINMFGGMEYPPKVQKSDRTDIQPRTNFLENIFFYTKKTNTWQGVGYRVVDVRNGVGSLERFETNQFGFRPMSNRLSDAFVNEAITNSTYHHVADGVIHLAFIPYDRQGYRLGYDTTNKYPGVYSIWRANSTGKNMGGRRSDATNVLQANVVLTEAPASRPETIQYSTLFAFKSNAMPAYVDMELALLEPETLTQYYRMLEDQNPNATNFLARQITKVHLFRQRIPIRTAAQ